MRGKRALIGEVLRMARNIPAYAGKTLPGRLPPSAQREHPRVCGENYNARLQRVNREGTSPRMRGKLPLDDGQVTLGGNIPAYAGKTLVAAAPPCAAAEHPRVCGEN